MTGGFLSVPIMRPNICWNYLHVSILVVLLLTANTDSEGSDCSPDIRVRRHTAYEILVGRDLVINCTVVFCSSPPPAVSWLKMHVPVDVSNQSHIKTEWKLFKELEGVSYLIFQKIRSNDSGLYQCRSASDMGHAINVSVRGGGGGELSNVTWKNNTNSTDFRGTSPEIWMYVYSAAGIGAFVFLVIVVSVILMRGCKGKTRKEAQSENQYVAVPMVEELSPRQSPSDQSNVSTPQRHNKCAYGEVKQNRERPRPAAEDGGSVVYAALNHHLPPGAAPRPQRNQEESSVYAAIRVP
ncbi:B-and T-lymphocyte attenuator-like [Solea senegalensis]|uniref:B-and T-lymphocyte attenuator-like n=1 Tax=Solea senegalensis TaxID=28829 RepID=A0AAV6REY5_SOLSE|nr:B- and T-lymphocyte attenuator-like [Solea senegalensis]KAG7504082.1 B-and T-lymphocyte attenuator-like [Solea senegalensis]